MNKNWYAQIGALWLGFAAFSPVSSAASIDETLSATYQFSPAVQAARARFAIEKEEIPDALTEFSPTVDFDYRLGLQDNRVEGVNNYASVNNVAIEVNQMLYDGNGSLAALETARSRVQVAGFDLASVIQQVLLDAAIAHINVARDERILEASRKNEASLAKQLEATQVRQELGALTQTDVLQAESRLAEVQAEVINGEGLLEASRLAYFELVGIESEPMLHLPHHLDTLPTSEEGGLEWARSDNPQLRASKANVEVAKKQIDEAKTESAPEVFLRGRFERDNNSGGARNQAFDNTSVTLNLRVPLYEAGQTDIEVRLAEAGFEEAGQGYEVLLRQIERRVSTAWRLMNSFREVVRVRRRVLGVAELTLDGYQKEYKVGNRTTVDLLNAERDVFQAEISLIRAQANFATAAYQLLFAAGRMAAPGI